VCGDAAIASPYQHTNHTHDFKDDRCTEITCFNVAKKTLDVWRGENHMPPLRHAFDDVSSRTGHCQIA
jgi:hypothetical protein